MFDMQDVCRAFSLAWAKTGNKMAASIAIIAMTTSSSINVKAFRFIFDILRLVKGLRLNVKVDHLCKE
jgi:hypothetical protein